jgi:HSP20 family protein
MITLGEAMDALFDEAFTGPFGSAARMHVPAIDLSKTDDEVVVRASLPGIKHNQVRISVMGNQLTIKGEFMEKSDVKEKSYRLLAQRLGSFERSISLLKAEEFKPKVITVKAK